MDSATTDLASHSGLTIGDVSRLTGLAIDTLRYYDRTGLLGELPRSAGGHRVFDQAALGLLDVIVRLRRTGMPVEEVRRFCELVRSGEDELASRLALLQAHRERVADQLDQLTADLGVIDWKIAAYTATAAGTEVPPPPPDWPNPPAHLPDPDRFDAEAPSRAEPVETARAEPVEALTQGGPR